MRVRFIKTFSTARQVFRSGREYDVDSAEAAECINRRLAEAVKPAVKTPETKAAKAKQGIA